MKKKDKWSFHPNAVVIRTYNKRVTIYQPEKEDDLTLLHFDRINDPGEDINKASAVYTTNKGIRSTTLAISTKTFHEMIAAYAQYMEVKHGGAFDKAEINSL